MAQGTIKKLIADKGFGFIEGEKGDLFFHHSAVEGANRAGSFVRRGTGSKGTAGGKRASYIVCGYPTDTTGGFGGVTLLCADFSRSRSSTFGVST